MKRHRETDWPELYASDHAMPRHSTDDWHEQSKPDTLSIVPIIKQRLLVLAGIGFIVSASSIYTGTSDHIVLLFGSGIAEAMGAVTCIACSLRLKSHSS